MKNIRDYTAKISRNKRGARVWMQAKWLTEAGFGIGQEYSVEYAPGKAIITVGGKSQPLETRRPWISRKVAVGHGRPIIDLISAEFTKVMGSATAAHVIATPGKITVTAKA